MLDTGNGTQERGAGFFYSEVSKADQHLTPKKLHRGLALIKSRGGTISETVVLLLRIVDLLYMLFKRKKKEVIEIVH